jgi:hypothetical protein
LTDPHSVVEQGVVEEGDDASLVLVRSHLDAVGVAASGTRQISLGSRAAR